MSLINPQIGVELMQFQGHVAQLMHMDNSRATFEDFNCDATAQTWNFSSSLTGNARIFETAPTAGRPGVVTMRVGTSTAAACTQIMGSLAAPNFLLPSGQWEMLAALRMAQLSDVTNDFTFEFGAINQTNAQTAPTAGVWFSYNHALNGGNWTANVGGSVQNNYNTGLAADLNWHEFSIRGIGVSEIAFYIDGALVAGTTTTNEIPSQSTQLTVHAPRIRKSAGGVTRDFYIDYFFLGWSLLSPR